jgi:putative DNA primase/helicase
MQTTIQGGIEEGNKNKWPDATLTMKAAAHWYAKRGYKVFPVGTDKKPLIKDWQNAASSAPAQVDQWYDRWPDANIAIQCGRASNLAVIDIDVKNGAQGAASAGALEEKYGEYASGLKVKTPSGGSHHWYAHGEAPFNTNAGRAGDAIDLRSGNADGGGSGYVLVAPSIVDGKRYTWIDTDTGTPAIIPDGVALALCFTAAERAVIDSTTGLKQRIVEKPRAEWRNGYNLARTFPTGGACRLVAGTATPRTDLGLDHPYIAKALEAELDSISGERKNQNENLSRRSASIGTLLAGMGFTDDSQEAKSVKVEIYKAARSMKSLDTADTWDSAKGSRAIEATIEGQFAWGISNPRDLTHVAVARAKDDEQATVGVKSAKLHSLTPDINLDLKGQRVAQLVSMHDVEAKPVEWLWPMRIPKGALSIIAGDPSQGKSQITCYMAAVISTGKPWCDDDKHKKRPASNVILLNAEDAADTVIKPRLLAAGADVRKVYTIKSVLKYNDRGEATETDMSLAQDMQALDLALTEKGNVGLVVIDPISAYLGKVDSHNNSEVRGILAPLARLAEKHNVAMVCVSHLNKGSGGKVTDRVTGSLAFSAAARAVYLVGSDPDDDADEDAKMFVAGKTNLAPNVKALSFKIESHTVWPEAGPIETSRVAWGAEMSASVDDMLRGKDDKPDGRKAGKDKLTAWLSTYLADGYWHPFDKIEDAAKRVGIDKSRRTFERAANEIGVEMRRGSVGEAGSEWQLPKRH